MRSRDPRAAVGAAFLVVTAACTYSPTLPGPIGDGGPGAAGVVAPGQPPLTPPTPPPTSPSSPEAPPAPSRPPAPGGDPPDAATPPADASGGGTRADAAAPDGAGRPDAGPPADAARPPTPTDTGPPAPTCAQPCPGQQNCVNGLCAPPAASCGAIKGRMPGASDGLYWVAVAGAGAQRVYCDMATSEILCGPTATTRRGRTREGSALPFTFSAQLLPGDRLCKIWAVRHATDGYPFKNLAPTAGLTLDTCQALGFRRDGNLTQQCGYGRERTDCGFGIRVPFYLYGNDCDCVRRPDGSPRPTYVKEGVGIRAGNLEIGISVSNIPWNASGTVFGTCAVQ